MISAIVLAAGLSKRMGKPKMTLLVGGVPLLQRVLEVLRRTVVDEVVVVLGPDSVGIGKAIDFRDERIVINRSQDQGMSSSLRLGIRSVSRDSDAALVMLGDQPFVSHSTVDRIIKGYRGSRSPAVVPVYDGVRGNPVLLDRSVFKEVMKVRGDVGAKSVVKRYGAGVLEVPVRDAGALFDVDTPSDYERASSRLKRRRTRGEGGPSPSPLRRPGSRSRG